MSGLNIDLDDDIFYDKNGNFTFDNIDKNKNNDIEKKIIREIYIGSLIIHKSYRKKGFARLLLSHSLLFVVNIGYHKLSGSAAPKLIKFYEHLGAIKEQKKTFTFNEFSVIITDEMIKNAENEIKNNKYGYKIVDTL